MTDDTRSFKCTQYFTPYYPYLTLISVNQVCTKASMIKMVYSKMIPHVLNVKVSFYYICHHDNLRRLIEAFDMVMVSDPSLK